MIKEKLLNKNYYLNLMSMFMKNSYGISELIEAMTNLMIDMDETEEKLVKALDVFETINDHSYYQDINEYEASLSTGDNKNIEFLDMLGDLVGLKRKFNILIPQYTETDPKKIISYETEPIQLGNKLMLSLIKLFIVKNNWDGSREQLISIYANIGIPISIINAGMCKCDYYLDTKTLKDNLNFLYGDQHEEEAQKDAEMVEKLFKYTDMFIHSVGIIYEKRLSSEINYLFILDSDTTGILDDTRGNSKLG